MALLRWETPFFSSAVASPNVLFKSFDKKIESNPKLVSPLSSSMISPSVLPSNVL